MRKALLIFCSLLLTAALGIQTVSVNAAAVSENTISSQPSDGSASAAYPDSYYWPAQSDSIPGWPSAPSIQAEAAVLMDARTGNILYSKNQDEIHYPASITKIMTTLLALENCEDYQDLVTFSPQAVYTTEENSSTLYIGEGEQLTLSQCLYGIMLASANEIAYGVGEYTSGNLKRFVETMNARARELGCKNTHFNNASGLPDERHYTTAYDMALIARAAWQNPWFRKITGTQTYTIPATNLYNQPRELYNHHQMVRQSYPCKGCVGGKTGYTSQAGNTLVTYVRRGSVTLIAVVLKSYGSSVIYDDTSALIEYGFGSFHRIAIPVDRQQYTQLDLLPNASWLNKKLAKQPTALSYEDGYAVVPKGIEEKDLIARKTFLPIAGGCWKIQTDYFYNNCKVGVSYSYFQKTFQTLLSQEEFSQ